MSFEEVRLRSLDGSDFSGLTQDGRRRGSPRTLNHAFELLTNLPAARARSNYLATKNALMSNYVAWMSDVVVGPNMPALVSTPKKANGDLDMDASKAIEEAWLRWVEEADFISGGSLGDLLRLAVRTWCIDGEAFLLPHIERGQLRIELLDGLRVPLQHTHYYGFRLNEEGQIEDWIVGDFGLKSVKDNSLIVLPHAIARNSMQLNTYPFDDVAQLVEFELANQYRGFPDSLSVEDNLNTLDDFFNYALQAARYSAKVGVAVTTPIHGDAGAARDAMRSNFDKSDESLKMLMLQSGQSIAPISWNYPHQAFGPFVEAQVNNIATGLKVPAYILSGSMSSFNFSSARIADSRGARRYMVRQRKIGKVLSTFFKKWLRMALRRDPALQKVAGTLGIESHSWEHYRFEHIQPKEEAAAMVSRIQAGVSSISGEARRIGKNPEDLAKELELDAKLGLRPLPTVTGEQPQQPAAKPPEVEDDQES